MKLADIEAVGRNVEEGGWVKGIPNLPSVAFKVRGRYNSDYSRLYSELTADLTPEQQTEREDAIETQLILDTLLLDWNIEDVTFSRDAAEQVLSDPKFKILRRGVIYAANVVATLGTATLEDAAKN